MTEGLEAGGNLEVTGEDIGTLAVQPAPPAGVHFIQHQAAQSSPSLLTVLLVGSDTQWALSWGLGGLCCVW